MNVLIIGVNGFLGAAIAADAGLRGHKVTGLSRAAAASCDVDMAYVAGDRQNIEQIRQCIIEQDIDVVVDVIAMTAAATLPLLSCLGGLVDHYIMLSSCDVYANYELLQRRAEGKPALAAVDETSPLRSSRYPYRGATLRAADDPNQYLDDYDKIPIEQAVQELTSAWTILRLPMVYGPGDRQHRFRWAIAPMLQGVHRLGLPVSWANWVSTYGYVDNIGTAVAQCLGNSAARNMIFNLAEANPVSQLHWANRFARHINWTGSIETTDDGDHNFKLQLSDLDLAVPFKIDGSKFRKTVSRIEAVDLATALRRTVASEMSGSQT